MYTVPLYTGFTTAQEIMYSAGTLDYKGPLDYLRSREDATVDNRLTTKKIKGYGWGISQYNWLCINPSR